MRFAVALLLIAHGLEHLAYLAPRPEDETSHPFAAEERGSHSSSVSNPATPECYYFRGHVSRTIRTYSKFLHLPATYSSQGSHFTRPGGSMSEGTTA